MFHFNYIFYFKNEMLKKGYLWQCLCQCVSVVAIESLGKEVYKIRKFINTCL